MWAATIIPSDSHSPAHSGLTRLLGFGPHNGGDRELWPHRATPNSGPAASHETVARIPTCHPEKTRCVPKFPEPPRFPSEDTERAHYRDRGRSSRPLGRSVLSPSCLGGRTGPAPAPGVAGSGPANVSWEAEVTHARLSILVPAVPVGPCRGHARADRALVVHLQVKGFSGPRTLRPRRGGRGCAGRERGRWRVGPGPQPPPCRPGQPRARRPPRAPRVPADLRLARQRPVENAGCWTDSLIWG